MVTTHTKTPTLLTSTRIVPAKALARTSISPASSPPWKGSAPVWQAHQTWSHQIRLRCMIQYVWVRIRSQNLAPTRAPPTSAAARPLVSTRKLTRKTSPELARTVLSSHRHRILCNWLQQGSRTIAWLTSSSQCFTWIHIQLRRSLHSTQLVAHQEVL